MSPQKLALCGRGLSGSTQSDNQSSRFLKVKTGRAWEDCQNDWRMNREACEEELDLKTLKDTPLWDWPKDDGKIFLEIFSDDQVDEPERPLARATGHERIRGSR